MKHIAIVLTSAALALGTQAHASTAPEQLAKDAGCLSCHSVSTKIVGPAYKDIAAKNKGQADAADRLAQSVRNGSKGNWGRIPMPAHGSLSDADIKTLVKWVLAQ